MKNYLRRILILISSLAMVLCLISVYVRLPVKAEDGQDMYRMYNPNSGEHFYTASINERNNLLYVGWQYEGVGWVAPVSSDSPVYRLYNANGGEHHYTLDASEKDMLVRAGWNYEGIGWYSDDAKKIPLYREYNPNAFSCNHNYTTDKSEHDYLVSIGWRDEGIGWYGIDVGSSVPSIMLEQNNVEMMCTYDNSNGYYYPDSDQTMKLVLYYRTKPGVTVISWTSSDESVAKISEFPTGNGPFNGMGNINFQLKLGTVTFTAHASDGSSASCVYNFVSHSLQAVREAEQYEYSIRQILPPYGDYFAVKTDYPKPLNVRFSIGDGDGKIMLEPVVKKFADVRYYNESTLEISPHEYLFALNTSKTDTAEFYGGNLTVEATIDDYQPGYEKYAREPRDWVKGTKQVNVPHFITTDEYLLKTYADPTNGSFAQKLRAVQHGLNDLAVYPQFVLDRSKLAVPKYPYLAWSPYKEMGLNVHIGIYQDADVPVLSKNANPYCLDSLAFPYLLEIVAYEIDPNCSVDSGPTHSTLKVTFSDGSSGTFGGAGTGSYNGIYIDLVQEKYDLSDNKTLNLKMIHDDYLHLGVLSDVEAKPLLDSLSATAIAKALPNGGWARVTGEGFQWGYNMYAYFWDEDNNGAADLLKNCWVDGRYVDYRGTAFHNQTFDQHPYARIFDNGILYV